MNIVDYEPLIKDLNRNNGETSYAFRKKMAQKVFKEISNYDKIISKWFNEN